MLLCVASLLAQTGPKPPKVLKTAILDYPEEARLADAEGTLKMDVTVGSDGHVLWVKVTRGAGYGMDQAAESAVRKWKFQPAEEDGKPVVGTAPVEINFRK